MNAAAPQRQHTVCGSFSVAVPEMAAPESLHVELLLLTAPFSRSPGPLAASGTADDPQLAKVHEAYRLRAGRVSDVQPVGKAP